MMPALHYALLAFIILSAIFNAIVVFAILRFRRSSPHLRGSFFTLIIFHGIADIMLAAEFTILMRFRKYRYLDFMLTEGNTLWYILPWITNGLHYYLKAVIYMGNILLSFNRFTSAFYPMHYEPFWASKQMVVVRVLAWILPLAAVLPIVLNFHNYNMNFSMGTNNETVRLGGDDTSTQLLSYVDGSLTLAATVICLIFYIATAISISRKMMKHGMQQKQAVEIRLFISSFFIFAVLTLNAISQVWTIIASKRGDTVIVMWLNDLSYPLLDVMYSANPWILCATSSAIRDVLLRIFLPFRFTGSRIRVVPTTSAIIQHHSGVHSDLPVSAMSPTCRLFFLFALALCLCPPGASIISSHNQMRVFTCIAEKEGEDAKCAVKLMKKPDAADFESAPKGKGCFSGQSREDNSTRVYCPIYCNQASSAYVISKKPANNNKCIKFKNYQLSEVDGEYFFWRSGPCLKEELQFDLGCSFDFFEGMMEVKEFLVDSKRKQI